MLDKTEYVESSILTAYSLQPPIELFILPQQGNSTHNLGVRTGAGEYILRTYSSDTSAVLYEHRLYQWLGARNLSFAVPTPITTMDGKTLLQSPVGLQALSVRLPGPRLKWHDPQQVEIMGAALGELHVALSHYENLARPGTAPVAELERAHPLLPDPFSLTPRHLNLEPTPAFEHLFGRWREEIAQVQRTIKRYTPHLPSQVIHGDYIPSNLLVKAGQVTAVLDFEFATYDLRVLDIASALRNMLRPWEGAEPWEIADRFSAGYRRWIHLSEEEIDAILPLIRLRNIWLALRRVGRALATGNTAPGVQQIEYALELAQWLTAAEMRLAKQCKVAL